jgi:MFS family permease
MQYEPPANGFRTFLIMWITQSISLIGSAVTFFAITIWLVQTLYPRPDQQAELAFALAAVGLAMAFPSVFLAPIGGASADRYDRKQIMFVSDLVSALVVGILLLLMITNTLTLWPLIGLIFLASCSGVFHTAAFDTSYVMLVSKAQLPRANGMMQTMFGLSNAIAPAIAASIIVLPALARQGVLPAFIAAPLAALHQGVVLVLALDIISFLLAAVVLLLLHVPSPKRSDMVAGQAKPSLWSDIRAGGVYIWRRRTLLWLLGTFAVANFCFSGNAVFVPLLVKVNLADDWAARGFNYETALALVNGVSGAGGILFGVLVSLWGGLRERRIYGVLVPMLGSGLAQVVYGLSDSIYLSAACGAIVLGMIPLMNAHSQAIWQTQVPPELQGRVFAVRRVIAQGTFPLSTAVAGVLGGLFNPGMVMTVLGGFFAIFCCVQLFNPWLLRVEDKEWLDQQAALGVRR